MTIGQNCGIIYMFSREHAEKQDLSEEQAQSTQGFVTKMSIALKETSETKYWIRLLASTSYLTEAESASILNDCVEIEKILVSIIKSSK